MFLLHTRYCHVVQLPIALTFVDFGSYVAAAMQRLISVTRSSWSMLSPHSCGLNGEWGEVDARNDVEIFMSLLLFSLRLNTAGLDIKLFECVRTSIACLSRQLFYTSPLLISRADRMWFTSRQLTSADKNTTQYFVHLIVT